MAVDVLGVKLGIKLGRYFPWQLIIFLENVLKGAILEFWVRLPLLVKALGRQDLCLRICLFPWGDLEVVLEVWRGDVFHVSAEGLDCLTNFGCEADGREYCEGAGGKFDYYIERLVRA